MRFLRHFICIEWVLWDFTEHLTGNPRSWHVPLGHLEQWQFHPSVCQRTTRRTSIWRLSKLMVCFFSVETCSGELSGFCLKLAKDSGKLKSHLLAKSPMTWSHTPASCWDASSVGFSYWSSKCGPQPAVLGPKASAMDLPRNLLQRQILGPHPSLLNQKL